MKPGVMRMERKYFVSQLGRNLLCVHEGNELVIMDKGRPVAVVSKPECRCEPKSGIHEDVCHMQVPVLG